MFGMVGAYYKVAQEKERRSKMIYRIKLWGAGEIVFYWMADHGWILAGHGPVCPYWIVSLAGLPGE